jgi:opacity protein-like surface antigen
MNAYRLLTLTFAALLLSAAVPAQAQAGDWEVGFGIGATRLDSNLDEEAGEELRVEARGGYFLTDRFEIEAQLSRTNAYFEAQLDTAMLNAVYNFGRAGAAVPYMLVGAGGARIQDGTYFFEGDDDEIDEQGLAVQAGIGTRLFFGSSNRVAARLEASILSEELLDERQEHVSVTAGLLWRIGR